MNQLEIDQVITGMPLPKVRAESVSYDETNSCGFSLKARHNNILQNIEQNENKILLNFLIIQKC